MDTHVVARGMRSLSSLGLTTLPNAPYMHPQHAVMRPREQNHWTFQSGGVEGVSLQNAYDGMLAGLHGGDDELFPPAFGKVGIMFTIKGHAPYRHMKHVHRVRKGVTRREVVEHIAEATVAYLRQVTTTDDHDGTFTFGPGGIQLRDLYLLELRRFRKTIVPVLGYTVPWDPALLEEIDWDAIIGELAQAENAVPNFAPQNSS